MNSLLSQIEPALSHFVMIFSPILLLFSAAPFGVYRRYLSWFVLSLFLSLAVYLDWVLIEHLTRVGLFENPGGKDNLAPLLGGIFLAAAFGISLVILILMHIFSPRERFK